MGIMSEKEERVVRDQGTTLKGLKNKFTCSKLQCNSRCLQSVWVIQGGIKLTNFMVRAGEAVINENFLWGWKCWLAQLFLCLFCCAAFHLDGLDHAGMGEANLSFSINLANYLPHPTCSPQLEPLSNCFIPLTHMAADLCLHHSLFQVLQTQHRP